ncbi:EcsC family protein [Trinickia caryophylli]|uniref:EcsC protein family protein n=1 Tax=Trinickia caryophylli TaxID=28094 RepID=A0A1X7ESP0_TRICW|nr:EcsC family protein [Trinickia caryophylli]PMS12097.1 EcsC family protein [Trinickia caryophylli]TRX18597.1 EcsC family protein [Trinickia caryophylli]WQE10608.1 EcsC family protein [Trinickia caryophylli]SMF39283.1 EcsC protein family protein [Trinickia caryophylli]GLU32974.1 protease [Trinickia caryophylli]
MKPIPTAAGRLDADDLSALALAKRSLEREPLAMKLAGAVGTPVEKLLERLPAVAHETIATATRRALEKCLQAALASVGGQAASRHGSSRDVWHKLAVATTGAAGGAFGLLALPAELPVTTTLMFRSICEIARSEGEDLSDLETQLQCLAVFGLGGGARRTDEEADFGYFVARGALAQAISKVSSEFASKSAAAHGTPALLRVTNAIAARFSAQVSEQAAAKSIPAIGAVLGALVNTVFIDHFQQTAHGHFTVRRLERRYGSDIVKQAYEAIELSLRN